MSEYGFEKLDVWQEARSFAKDVYLITLSFPQSEMFGLSSQLRRAAISICSNIAEGSTRISAKDQAHFYEISYGSLMEVLCQLMISHDLNMLSEDTLRQMRKKIDAIAHRLNSLRKAALLKINPK